MTAVGIDFGTTNSVLAVHAAGRTQTVPIESPPADWAALGFDRVMPTVVSTAEDGTFTFGWEAKLSPREKVEAVKRMFRDESDVAIGSRTFPVEEIATLFFGKMVRNARAAGIDATQAVVTVPANSRGLARYRTKVCAGMAGLEVLALINEPTAAAMAHSAGSDADQRIMVVDWGGGTLDVTILQASDGVFIEQASKGIQQLGGLDFDARLARLILDRVPQSASWDATDRAAFRIEVEMAKIRLSAQEYTNIALPRGGFEQVTRADFETAVQPLIERVRLPIEQCLADIRDDASAIDALVLVGGTCKMPAIRDFVGTIVGTDPSAHIDPMTAVAEGAAIAAGILTGALEDNDFFVGTEHALGIFVHEGEEAVKRFSTIIPRNHRLPAKSTETYYPRFDDQELAELSIVEGDPQVEWDHEDNVVLRDFTVELPERDTIAEKAIDITYTYDVDGILHVTVQDQMTDEVLLEEEVSFGHKEDKRRLVGIAKRTRDALDASPATADEVPADAGTVVDDPVARELMQKARIKVLPFLDAGEQEPIKEMLKMMAQAPLAEAGTFTQQLRDELAPYSYLF